MTETHVHSADKDEASRYYPRAASWAGDREAALRNSARVAWVIAAAALVAAVAEAVALAALAPLKTVVPYTLLVDRTTGYVQAVDGLAPEQISPDRALVQAQLAQYVVAREGFDRSSLSRDYRKVALWSGDSARRDYLAMMPAGQPSSPLTRLAAGERIEVRIKSISPLGPQSALVRFESTQARSGEAGRDPEHWVSAVDYRYVGAPMSLEDRLVNPLGFQVIRYHRSQEALPVALTAPIVHPASAPGEQP